MNKAIVAVLFTALVQLVAAQKATYELIKDEADLAFYSKWVTLKGENTGKQALFIKVTNKTDRLLSYSLGVEVFVDQVMVEEAPEALYCIRPKKTNQGKVNCIYFVSDKVTPEDLASGKTVVELTGLVITGADICPKRQAKK